MAFSSLVARCYPECNAGCPPPPDTTPGTPYQHFSRTPASQACGIRISPTPGTYPKISSPRPYLRQCRLVQSPFRLPRQCLRGVTAVWCGLAPSTVPPTRITPLPWLRCLGFAAQLHAEIEVRQKLDCGTSTQQVSSDSSRANASLPPILPHRSSAVNR